jgi:DNA polymerase III subunit epsilon
VLFAITDIETTGGFASGNSITEIAICIHDGTRVINEWQSLIKPEGRIPNYITALTGIDDAMVEDAPTFEEVAETIEELTKDAIFVAHNVNFDYSFIKRHFEAIGTRWNRPKLCTVRLSKATFEGFKSYSLGNLCRQLEITNESAHRAMGDTRATVQLFERIIATAGIEAIETALKRGSGEAFLPNHIDAETYHSLPDDPGIYYFLNSKGKVIYVGKAKNIKTRVKQHFTGNMRSARRQAFLRDIHKIDHLLTGTELVALLIEDREIKRLWPEYNRAQKHSVGKFGIYSYFDQLGYTRLCVKKAQTTYPPIRAFTSAFHARQWLFKFADQYDIHYKFCGLPHSDEPELDVDEHNQLVNRGIDKQNHLFGSFLIKGKGREHKEESVIWVDNGQLKGVAFVSLDHQVTSESDLENIMEVVPHTGTTASILNAHLEKVSQRNIIILKEATESWD